MKIELKGLPTFSVNIGLYDEEKAEAFKLESRLLVRPNEEIEL